jgi:hypothetical protein
MQSNTVFKGQNNFHTTMPALMSDDREHRSWYPEAVVDQNIKKTANITSNWDYRKYLTSNASHLMDINARNAVMQNPSGDALQQSSVAGAPYVFHSPNDMTQVRPGVFGSDLKTTYLSRTQLQAKAVAPSVYSNTSR